MMSIFSLMKEMLSSEKIATKKTVLDLIKNQGLDHVELSKNSCFRNKLH